MDSHRNDNLQEVEDLRVLEVKDMNDLDYISIKDYEHLETNFMTLDSKHPEEGLIELVMYLEERDLKDVPFTRIEIETSDIELEIEETNASLDVGSQKTKAKDDKNMIIKPEVKVMCTQCGFKGLDDLGLTIEGFDNHRKTLHKEDTKDKVHMCPRLSCGKLFTSNGNLLAHAKYKHVKKKEEYNNLASRKGINKKDTKDKIYMCLRLSCGNIFTTKDSLSVHTKEKHSRENIEYNPVVPKKKIINRSNADKDYRTLVERTQLSTFVLPIRNKKRGRPFGSKLAKDLCSCSICTNKKHNIVELAGNSHKCNKSDKIINKWGNFQDHMRSHEGIRPYACMVQNCSSAFVRSADLERHMNCHSLIVRFTCPKCGKTFIRTDHHKRHLKKCNNSARNIRKCDKSLTLISGNFCCKECDKSFDEKDDLKNHNDEHHKIEQLIQ